MAKDLETEDNDIFIYLSSKISLQSATYVIVNGEFWWILELATVGKKQLNRTVGKNHSQWLNDNLFQWGYMFPQDVCTWCNGPVSQEDLDKAEEHQFCCFFCCLEFATNTRQIGRRSAANRSSRSAMTESAFVKDTDFIRASLSQVLELWKI